MSFLSRSAPRSRRQFLNQAARILPLVFLLPGYSSAQLLPRTVRKILESPNEDQPWDCIVIGAGVSGLTLARELATSGQIGVPSRRVLVLEASPRLGGRVHTDRGHFSRQVERGAEFVHMGPLGAPVWEELLRYKLHVRKLSKLDGRLYDPSGKAAEATRPIVRAAIDWGVFKALGAWRSLRVDRAEPDISAGDFLERFVAPKGDRFEEDYKRMILTGHLGALEEDLSMRGFQSDAIPQQLKYLGEFYVRAGYDALVGALAQDLDIRTQHPVRKIRYSSQGVVVETENGHVFRAKTAAITVSVGALKAGNIEFDPPLPEEKQAAIDSLEMSYHAKMQIEFDQRFWPAEMSMVHRADEGRRVGKTYFVPQTDAPNAPPMLSALIMGKDAQRILTRKPDEIFRDVCLDLESCFPEAGPILERVRRRSDGSFSYLYTHWNEDPFARGGVSFIRYGAEGRIAPERVRTTYAAPESTPGLFWAGEASATYEQAASVHGAHSAGARAAIEIQHYLSSGASYLAAADLHSRYRRKWMPYFYLAGTPGKSSLLPRERDRYRQKFDFLIHEARL